MQTNTAYKVTRTTPRIYSREGGRPINGYKVDFELIEYDEEHHVLVPSLDHKVVNDAMQKLYEQRVQLGPPSK